MRPSTIACLLVVPLLSLAGQDAPPRNKTAPKPAQRTPILDEAAVKADVEAIQNGIATLSQNSAEFKEMVEAAGAVKAADKQKANVVYGAVVINIPDDLLQPIKPIRREDKNPPADADVKTQAAPVVAGCGSICRRIKNAAKGVVKVAAVMAIAPVAGDVVLVKAGERALGKIAPVAANFVTAASKCGTACLALVAVPEYWQAYAVALHLRRNGHFQNVGQCNTVADKIGGGTAIVALFQGATDDEAEKIKGLAGFAGHCACETAFKTP